MQKDRPVLYSSCIIWAWKFCISFIVVLDKPQFVVTCTPRDALTLIWRFSLIVQTIENPTLWKKCIHWTLKLYTWVTLSLLYDSYLVICVAIEPLACRVLAFGDQSFFSWCTNESRPKRSCHGNKFWWRSSQLLCVLICLLLRVGLQEEVANAWASELCLPINMDFA